MLIERPPSSPRARAASLMRRGSLSSGAGSIILGWLAPFVALGALALSFRFGVKALTLIAAMAFVAILVTLPKRIAIIGSLLLLIATLPMAESWRYVGLPNSAVYVGPLACALVCIRIGHEFEVPRNHRTWAPLFVCVSVAMVASVLGLAPTPRITALFIYVMPLLLLPIMTRIIGFIGVPVAGLVLSAVSGTVGLVGIAQALFHLRLFRYDVNIHGIETVSDVGLSQTVKAVAFMPYGTIYASFLGISLVAALDTYFRSRHQLAKTSIRLQLLLLGATSLALVLTYERASTVAAFLGAALVYIQHNAEIGTHVRSILLGSGVGVILWSSGMLTPLIARLSTLTVETTSTGRSTSSVRTAAMRTGLNAAAQNPFGLGVGKSSEHFLDYSVTGNVQASPQNALLYLLIELGWVSGLALIVWLLLAFKGMVGRTAIGGLGVAMPILTLLMTESAPAHPSVWWLIPIVFAMHASRRHLGSGRV